MSDKRTEAEQIVTNVIREQLCIEVFSLDSKFGEEIRADSLEIVEMMIVAEERVGKEIPSTRSLTVKTPREMAALLEEYL